MLQWDNKQNLDKKNNSEGNRSHDSLFKERRESKLRILSEGKK
jgi:hypothetical protein